MAPVVLLRYKPGDKSFMSKIAEGAYKNMSRIREKGTYFWEPLVAIHCFVPDLFAYFIIVYLLSVQPFVVYAS